VAFDVVLIDDDEDVAVLVETMLALDDRFQLVGSARSAADGIELAGDLQPDVIVLDLHLPGLDGIEALPILRRVGRCPIVVFSAFPDPYTLLTAVEHGADGYVDKGRAWSELLPTLAALCELLSRGRQE
jgi:two-component system nitrate/nitrite response regulator NarL